MQSVIEYFKVTDKFKEITKPYYELPQIWYCDNTNTVAMLNKYCNIKSFIYNNMVFFA